MRGRASVLIHINGFAHVQESLLCISTLLHPRGPRSSLEEHRFTKKSSKRLGSEIRAVRSGSGAAPPRGPPRRPKNTHRDPQAFAVTSGSALIDSYLHSWRISKELGSCSERSQLTKTGDDKDRRRGQEKQDCQTAK